ncbi:MAG: D-2-hydroxyacid dehydrogenase [Armatimonadota bacterium]
MPVRVLVPESIVDDLTIRLRSSGSDFVDLVGFSVDAPFLRDSHADVVIRWIAGARFDELMDPSRKQWLHTASAGVDHVMVPAVLSHPDLILTDSGPAYGPSMAEFVITWMLSVTHKVPQFLEMQKDRHWEWVTHSEVAGSIVGIIGAGPVAQHIARACKAVGCKVMMHRKRPISVAGVDNVFSGLSGLMEMLPNVDWLVVACAMTPETAGIVSRQVLDVLKPGTRIINVARGGVIDQYALLRCLDSGQVSAAVLDVTTPEPLPVDSALWSHPNVHITCHSSAWTEGLRVRLLDLFVDNLRRYVSDEPLLNVVDFKRGY